MNSNLVKVMDASTMALKRWENAGGKTLAEVKRKKLVLTELGKAAGYKVVGLMLQEAK